MDIASLKCAFKETFNLNHEKTEVYFSPGRVNLIGEHIDYNGGMVLPVAIDLGTYAIVSKRADRTVRVSSLNFSSLGVLSFSLDDISYRPDYDWANYPMGVFHTMIQAGHSIPYGFDILYMGDLPNGAGLSSSASIEVLTATIVNETYGLGISVEEIALLCQKSENVFNGVNCGIMDQFSIAVGKSEHALLLNCDTLAYEHVPADLGDYRIVIINTNKKRGLVDSEYNKRREECEEALGTLGKVVKIEALCDLTPKDFLAVSEQLKGDSVYKRAYHAVVENARTIKGKEALVSGDLISFGEWMYRSHDSLKNYYEVSCPELDAIVEISGKIRGVLGARMTGAGFGGCAIALVHEAHIESYKQQVSSYYNEKTGLIADFYVAKISGGASRVE